MERSMRKAFSALAGFALCAVLAVFGAAAWAWGDEASAADEAAAVEEASVESEAAADDASATLSVSVHQQSVGWTEGVASGEVAGAMGEDLRIEAIALTLTADVSGSISYSVDCLDYGWTDWASDGETAGTTGESQPITAIKVKLTDEAAEAYDVWYRVWVDGYGWTGWAKNGAAAGTTSGDAILEGVEVVVLAKGSEAPGDVLPAVITSSFAAEGSAEESEDAAASTGEDAAASESDAADVAASTAVTGDPTALEESLLVDNELFSVTAMGIEVDEYGNYQVNLSIANKSDSASFDFIAWCASIDGVAVDTNLYVTVSPGKSATVQLPLYEEDLAALEAMGVDLAFTDIEFELHAYETATDSYEEVYSESLHLYPFGEAAATTFVREAQESDVVLFQTDSYSVTALGLVQDDDGGYYVALAYQNTSDELNFDFNTWSAAVDGLVIDSSVYVTVGAGKTAYAQLPIAAYYLEEFEAAGFSVGFSDIEFNLEVYDDDTYETLLEETILHYYPDGEAAATTYVREAQDADTVLVDNDYLTLSLVASGVDEEGNLTLGLLIENKCDSGLSASIYEESADGVMISSSYWSDYISAGDSLYGIFYLYAAALEDVGISDPSTISLVEFNLVVYDENYWDELLNLDVSAAL